MKKPNILFCIADDASHFGYNGFGYVKTPNIDKLAYEGVICENAFTTNPKCAPSRASILSGMHTWELKEGCNHFTLFPANIDIYPDILERDGYYTGYTGKGWAPGDYITNGRTRNPAGDEYNSHKIIPPEDSRISRYDYTENFRQFIEGNDCGRPFCFWFGAIEPHRPYNLGESCDFDTEYNDISYMPSYFPDTETVRRDLLDYAFEINWFDRHVGNMVKILEEKGMLEDTFILVTSDNGMPFPRIKGQMYEQDVHLPMVAYWKGHIVKNVKLKELISFIDIAPTFLELAGVHQDFMSGQSMLGLLIGEKDCKDRQYVYFGREKHDVGREDDAGYPVRCIRNDKWLYVRNYKPDRWPSGNPETQYTNCDLSPTKDVIMKMAEKGNDRYLDYCFGKRGAEELYNIEDDIECMNNLINVKEYAGIKENLRMRMDRKLEETKDPRHFGDGDVFENYPSNKNRPHSWQSYVNGTFKPIGPEYTAVKGMKGAVSLQ